jgi:Methyltransferase domain
VNDIACRLCGGTAHLRFEGQLLERHRVQYFECQDCGSLQTEAPHWLDEAYADSNLSPLDTGAAQRNLNNLGAVLALARWLGLTRILDHGGGDGLLVRMLRDRGLDGHVLDRHARPKYAMGFGQAGPEAPELVTAFEVLEHFVHPKDELRQLFDGRPSALLISTDAWEGQGPGWWYLAPDTGQHVFFYSRRALAQVAAEQGFQLLRVGGYWLFLRHGCFAAWRVRAARQLLSSRLRRLRNAWAVTRATPGVMHDHDRLAAAIRAAGADGEHAPR